MLDYSYLTLVKSHTRDLEVEATDFIQIIPISHFGVDWFQCESTASETSQAFVIAPAHKFHRYYPRVQPFYFAQSASHLRRSALPRYNARSSPSHTSPFIRPLRFARVQPAYTTWAHAHTAPNTPVCAYVRACVHT